MAIPLAGIAGYAHPSVAMSFSYGEERFTLLGRPYFDTYLEECFAFGKAMEGKKITVFTYKPKKNEKRKMGHRQPYTKVEISAINA